MPDVALSTDMIVGFPGETDADFDETLSLTDAVAVSTACSRSSTRERPNTLAAKRLPDDVPEDEKTRRIVALQALQRAIQTALHERAGRATVDVLVDAASRRRDTELSGRTTRQHGRELPGPAGLARADWCRCAIERAGPHSVWGGVEWAVDMEGGTL